MPVRFLVYRTLVANTDIGRTWWASVAVLRTEKVISRKFHFAVGNTERCCSTESRLKPLLQVCSCEFLIHSGSMVCVPEWYKLGRPSDDKVKDGRIYQNVVPWITWKSDLLVSRQHLHVGQIRLRYCSADYCQRQWINPKEIDYEHVSLIQMVGGTSQWRAFNNTGMNILVP
jgi:hypothetical protein